MSDEFAETDEWPTPEGWMRHQAETGLVPPRNATHRPSDDRVVWRDRGARIAALQAENDRLAAAVSEAQAETNANWQKYRAAEAEVDRLVRERWDQRAEIERLRKVEAGIRALADEWAYKGEFGWGAWQEGEGPDPEGYVLDRASSALRALLDPSPAATTGEAYYTCGHAYREHGCGWPCCGFPDRPAPVVTPSDTEAGQ